MVKNDSTFNDELRFENNEYQNCFFNRLYLTKKKTVLLSKNQMRSLQQLSTLINKGINSNIEPYSTLKNSHCIKVHFNFFAFILIKCFKKL